MGKIAIDVVLLPPEEVMDICIEVNKGVKDKLFVMSKKDFIPHNSLCMGVIDENELPKVFKVLQKLKPELKPIPITIKSIDRASGTRKSDWFKIEKNDILQRTHEKIVRALKPILEFQSNDLDILYRKPGEKVGTIPRTLSEGYLNFSLEKYNPHITLGGREARWKTFPMNYLATEMAVFHAGDHISCRKLLFKLDLR